MIVAVSFTVHYLGVGELESLLSFTCVVAYTNILFVGEYLDDNYVWWFYMVPNVCGIKVRKLCIVYE